jgi:riboflavin biosynthesis protein RibD
MTLDRQRLHEALTLAESVIGLTEPNPRVGCIIGHVDGRVLGRGATQEAGGPHAEVMALRDAAAAGHEVRGATAWVTLEPCAHHGRTPPCCDALVAAGMARVVVGARDPFPGVDGAGMARLRAAGIEVDLADPDIAAACRELNIGFFSRFERGRPWVRLKLAASLDAVTALADGRSQWITGPEARADGHAFRRRAGAVLSGIGTVLHDNPRLDVRLVPTPRQPLRVVLDSQWRTPPTARLFEAEGPLLLVGTPPADAAAQARATTLDALAATLEAPRGCNAWNSPVMPAGWTWPRCCPRWRRAASTNCTWRPAPRSTAPGWRPAWWTSCCCTWRPRCWAKDCRSHAWPHRPGWATSCHPPGAGSGTRWRRWVPTCACACAGRPDTAPWAKAARARSAPRPPTPANHSSRPLRPSTPAIQARLWRRQLAPAARPAATEPPRPVRRSPPPRIRHAHLPRP